jgi:hypothetical protein
MEPDRARAIAQVAGVLVDSARVEVDYIRATGQDVSNFIDGMKAPETVARLEAGEPRTQWRHGQPAIQDHNTKDEVTP